MSASKIAQLPTDPRSAIIEAFGSGQPAPRVAPGGPALDKLRKALETVQGRAADPAASGTFRRVYVSLPEDVLSLRDELVAAGYLPGNTNDILSRVFIRYLTERAEGAIDGSLKPWL
jgi:hypothetical protein